MSKGWETDEVQLARVNVQACAYNAAVNYGSGRAGKKMFGLIQALNYMLRAEGRDKLSYLKAKGVIDEWRSCPALCEMRPGGLFHAEGCENNTNHPVYRERTKMAEAKLTGEEGGERVAWVSLVGDPLPGAAQ